MILDEQHWFFPLLFKTICIQNLTMRIHNDNTNREFAIFSIPFYLLESLLQFPNIVAHLKPEDQVTKDVLNSPHICSTRYSALATKYSRLSSQLATEGIPFLPCVLEKTFNRKTLITTKSKILSEINNQSYLIGMNLPVNPLTTIA